MAQPVFHRRFLSTLLIQQIQDFKLKHRPEHTLSVLIADVDDCARFNAMHGRPAGDRMLQAVAGVLSQQVRGHDFVFRYSG
jgi:diguanylate cyclase (GGDEF)-like protein